MKHVCCPNGIRTIWMDVRYKPLMVYLVFVQKNKKPHEVIQSEELNAVELDSSTVLVSTTTDCHARPTYIVPGTDGITWLAILALSRTAG